MPTPSRPTTPSAEDETATRSSARASEDEQQHWDYCPNCGARLYNHGCKYRCPRCHYFMSCSDFD